MAPAFAVSESLDQLDGAGISDQVIGRVMEIMSRNKLITLLLIIASLLLAVALFIAGAIWRGRMTARSAATDSRRDQFTSVEGFTWMCLKKEVPNSPQFFRKVPTHTTTGTV